MTNETERRFRAGDRLDDLCRACGALRTHTVIAVGIDPPVVRVVCGYCGSQHKYRGGEQKMRAQRTDRPRAQGASTDEREPPGAAGDGAIPSVTERERRYPRMSGDASEEGGADLELMLRRVIREEMGLGPVTPAEKWRGGDLVLRPGKPGLQEKSWPIETFFHKIVMLRNRLRVLEQQVNGAELPDDLKVKLQGYITACYGTLTSFNILFAEEEDRFRGSSPEP